MSILRRLEKVLDERLRGVFATPQDGSREAIELYREALSQIAARAAGHPALTFDRIRIELKADSPDRRAVLEALFEPIQMLEDVRAGLVEEAVSAPANLQIAVSYPEAAVTELRVFCEKAGKGAPAPAPPLIPARLVTLDGVSPAPELLLQGSLVNVGRTRDVVDASGRPVRRNQLSFPEELNAELNSTVSRSHAHLKSSDGEWRIFDDGSSTGTAVFRDGVRIDVPAHASRGVGLRLGDEIYFGSVRVRLERA